MAADRFLHPRCGHSEKVTLLTDLEHRVWVQYLLSADDYGVMRCSAVTIQADNDHLARRPVKAIQRCLERLVTTGLVRGFEHQHRNYIYQVDWQDYQRIGYPRATAHPLPPVDQAQYVSAKTRLLFARHPTKRQEEIDEDLPKVPEILGEDLPPSRARETLTLTQTANAHANDPTREPPFGGGEQFMDRYRAHWKRLYGLESSVLMLSPLQIGQLLAQAKSLGWVDLDAALMAYFATDDSYAIRAKHPIGLFLTDPNKYLASSREPPAVGKQTTKLAAALANIRREAQG